MSAIPTDNVILFLIFIIVLDFFYARRRQKDIKRLQAENLELRNLSAATEDRVTLAQAGGLDTLPLALADASIAVFVIDRIPDNSEDCRFNCQSPVIWINPRLQRSWRWSNANDTWVETTIVGRNMVAQVNAFTPDDVFLHAVALHDQGCRRRLSSVTEADLQDPDDNQAAREAIAGMHPEICASMDLQTDDPVWTDIRNRERAGTPVSISREGRPVQPVARRDNPFEHRRRPINTEG